MDPAQIVFLLAVVAFPLLIIGATVAVVVNEIWLWLKELAKKLF